MNDDFNNVSASDLVRRLRQHCVQIQEEAADRIEELEDALRKIAQHPGTNSFGSEMKGNEVADEIQRWAEEALKTGSNSTYNHD